MRLKVLGSGSSGNCYILENDHTAMVLECGVPWKEIKQGLDFNLNKVAGILVSHEHLDHCRAVPDAILAGLDVYCTPGTLKAIGMRSHRFIPIQQMIPIKIGEWRVIAFDVRHDANEPCGFIIKHPDCGTVLFITDTYYVPHRFENVNNILIEANYCKDIVKQRQGSGELHAKVRDRVVESHMSIDTCKELLQANDLSGVNNIVLIHLSDGNSNAEDFQRQVQELTGKTVHVASRGMEINFSKTPF